MEINVKEKPGLLFIEQFPGIDGIYEQIKICGINRYRFTPESGKLAKEFVETMVSLGDYAVLEHGTIYLAIPVKNAEYEPHQIVYNKYTKASRQYTDGHTGYDYITTNYRVLVENNWLDLLQYWTEPTQYHQRRVCVLFDTNITVSRKFNLHRVNSIIEGNTEYCNYVMDKPYDAMTVIEPTWLRDRAGIINMNLKNRKLMDYIYDIATKQNENWEKLDYWLFSLEVANMCYQNLISLGCKPQEACDILPLAANTQLVHTAFVDDWKHFFEIQAEDTSTNHPHPMAMEFASALKKWMQERSYI